MSSCGGAVDDVGCADPDADDDGSWGEGSSVPAALPVGDCGLSEKELRNRIRDGVPPESAEEHLMRARIEAKSMPQVSEVDSKTLLAIREMVKGKHVSWIQVQETKSEEAIKDSPSAAWRKMVVDEFTSCRQYIAHWEDRVAELSGGFLPTDELLPKRNDVEEWNKLRQSKSPSVSILVRLNQKTCSKVLKDMIYDEADKVQVQGQAHDVEQQGEQQGSLPLNDRVNFSTDKCAWIYALLARIDKPLGVGMEAHLRQLLRMLYTVRRASDCAVDVVICILEDYFSV